MNNLIKKMISFPMKCKIRKIKSKINSKKSYKEIERIVQNKYKKRNGTLINWNTPKTYTEKLNVSKIYNDSMIKTELSDKYLVRSWVESKIGKEYLIPLLGVYDSFDDIDFEKLPQKFVIKCNHDSGSVTLCDDKTRINKKKLRRIYNDCLNTNFAYLGFEMHYKDIKPRLIIEKYMGNSVNDYKFLCFNGKPYYCWVDFDRFSNHKRNIYDMDWNLQPFNQMTYGNYEGDVERPSNFDEMVKIVNKLCKGFDHVRVDLYDIDGKIYFGEMTFTNGSGIECITPQEWDLKLGNLWNFESNRNKKTRK